LVDSSGQWIAGARRPIGQYALLRPDIFFFRQLAVGPQLGQFEQFVRHRHEDHLRLTLIAQNPVPEKKLHAGRAARLLPLLLAQSTAAFNEIFLLYQVVFWYGERSLTSLGIAGGIYLALLYLLSGWGGELALQGSQSRILRTTLFLQACVMTFTTFAARGHIVSWLLTALVVQALCRTCSVPAKSLLIARAVAKDRLLVGIALLQTSTFLVAIPAVLAAETLGSSNRISSIGIEVIGIDVLGWLASFYLPDSQTAPLGRRPSSNPFASLVAACRATRASTSVLLCLLGLAWFWFIFVVISFELPRYSQDVLHGDAAVAAMLFGLYCSASVAGSLLCTRLSGGRLEIGLVPSGSFGMTLSALDLVWGAPKVDPTQVLHIAGLMTLNGGWRVFLDIGVLGICGGLFSVPLRALIQERAPPESMPQIVGVGNVMNSLFVLAALLGVVGTSTRGVVTSASIVTMALMNAAVAYYIYRLVPEFLLRFVCWILVHTLYRLRNTGDRRLPDHGAALIVSNHVSFVDALIISAICPRPIHFIMDAAIFNAPIIKVLARGMRAIPIASAKDDESTLQQAFQLTAEALRRGELVCIFPEGRLTADGSIGEFRPGVMRILSETPVDVIPIAIVGLWGSMFTRWASHLWQRLPRKLGACIAVRIGVPLDAARVTPELLRREVQALYDRGCQAAGSESQKTA